MNIDLNHDDCPLLLACAEHDNKSSGAVLIETRTMSFDDDEDKPPLLPASSFFSSSQHNDSLKNSFLSSFPPRLRRRASIVLLNSQKATHELASQFKRAIRTLSTSGKDISRAIVLLTFLTCVIVFGVHFSSFQHLVIIFLQWIRTLGMMGGVIYIFATAFSTLVFIPTTLATLAAGYLFGLWFGFLFSFAGCCLGSVIAFLLGRTLFRSWVSSLSQQYPKVALMDQAIGKKAVGWKIVLLLRLSPMLPYNVLNYVLSVTRVRFIDYLVSSVVGMFPGVAVFVYFGSLSHDLTSVLSFSSDGMSGMGDESGNRTVIIYSGFILSLLAFILLSYFAAHAIKKELRKIEEENEQNEKDKKLDEMETQLQSTKTSTDTSDSAPGAVRHTMSLRQIDEALAEARKESVEVDINSVGVVTPRDERAAFEQNRSCGMRKNLSWVDASMA